MPDLPRPVTPGPWRVHPNTEWELLVIADPEANYGSYLKVAEIGQDETLDDARAIAALPDWISRADRLEALLREARERLEQTTADPRPDDPDDIALRAKIDAELCQ